MDASLPSQDDSPPLLLRRPSASGEEASGQISATAVTPSKSDTQRYCLLTITVLACLYTLHAASVLVLPIIYALILNLVLAPIKDVFVDRLHLPRVLAAAILVLTVAVLAGAIGYAVSIPATGWIARAPESLSLLREKFGFLARPFEMLHHGVEQVQQAVEQGAKSAESTTVAPPVKVQVQQAPDLQSFGMTLLSGTQAALTEVFTVLLLLFFFAAAGDTMLRRVVEVTPTWGDKRRIVEIVGEIERNISGYLLTISLMNCGVGIACGLVVWAMGVPDALLWGTVAFALNYIPIIGPVVGMVIFFIVGLFTLPSVAEAAALPGIYLLIHVVEGETITPMLLARRFTLNPVLVIISLLFWDFLWGIPGALLAVPLLAVMKIVCDRVPSLVPIGHVLGTTPRVSERAATG